MSVQADAEAPNSTGNNLSALLAGLIFGAGLVISGMTDPDKVLAFLRLGKHWDPSLIFVLGGAVVVATVGYWLVMRRSSPLFDEVFHTPTSTHIDRPLVVGGMLFGLGWGVAGYCPGPALVGLLTLDLRAAIFVLAFVVGMLIYERWLSVPTLKAARADG